MYTERVCYVCANTARPAPSAVGRVVGVACPISNCILPWRVCVRERPPLSSVVVSLIHLCRGGRTPTTHRQTPRPAAPLAHRSVITPLLSVVVVADRRRRRRSSSTPTRGARLLRSCRLPGCVSFLFSRLSRTPSPSARQTARGAYSIRVSRTGTFGR